MTTTASAPSATPVRPAPPTACAARRARRWTWPGACRGAARRGDRRARLGHQVEGQRRPWPTWPTRPTSTSARAAAAVPAGAADDDCNGDGRFAVADFATTVTDRNGNGLPDPEDLILDPAFTDGVDDDGNGYVDDISGWDFLYGDNDPLDNVDYGHGTGEAQDSTAADNGTGDVRHLCPRACSSRSGWRTRSSPTAAGSPPACCSPSTQGPTWSRRRSAPSTTRARPSRRSTPPTARGWSWWRSMADEAVPAPQPARRARAHDGGQLGHREATPGRPRHRATGRATPWPSTGAPTSAARLRVGAVERLLVGGHRELRPAWSASSRATARDAGIAPNPASGRRAHRAGAQRAVRRRGGPGAACHRRRHRLLHPERGRPGQRDGRRPAARPATRRCRAGTPPTATAASTPTSWCGPWTPGASHPRRTCARPDLVRHPARHRAPCR